MKVYIVQGSDGQYEERRDWIVCAFLNKESAEKLVKELDELNSFNKDVATKAREYRDSIESKYLLFRPNYPERPAMSAAFVFIRNACADGRDSNTPAMKAAYKRLNAEHCRKIEEFRKQDRAYSTAWKEWHDRLLNDVKEWIANYPCPSHLLEAARFNFGRNRYHDACYSVDEIEVVDG